MMKQLYDFEGFRFFYAPIFRFSFLTISLLLSHVVVAVRVCLCLVSFSSYVLLIPGCKGFLWKFHHALAVWLVSLYVYLFALSSL